MTFIKIGLILQAMEKGRNNIITTLLLRSCLLLALGFSSQGYSLCHSTHTHEDGSTHSVSHPIDFSEDHSLDHHHHADSQGDDHQHTIDKQIDWIFTRAQTQKAVTIDDQYIFSSSPLFFSSDNESSNFDSEKLPPFLDEYHASATIIRGPPLSA